jgi:hypothetical protein
MNADDPDRSFQFCGRFRHKVHEDDGIGRESVWSDEATFKLNGTANRHNFVYWTPENPHIFEGTVTCLLYLTQHASDIHLTFHSSVLRE